jgi:hypothetical protein
LVALVVVAVSVKAYYDVVVEVILQHVLSTADVNREN